MSTSVYTAAERLICKLHAPAGLVNTIVEQTKTGSRIRVLVDVNYKFRLSAVPKTFMGFPVVVDVREPVVAYS